jgi:GNAT superfamily N-acetyltransferase
VDVFPASPAQARVVAQLLVDFNAEFDTPGAGLEEFSGRLTWLLERDDVIVLLAGDGDHPTGFALVTLRPTVYYDGPMAQLEELYVRPDLRDRGIGTALLTTAIAWVRENQGGEMTINVDEIDVDTRRFYERHGFVNIEPGNEYRMLCYLQEL